MNVIVLATDIDHNIPDSEFKEAIAETSSRIRYGGQDFLKELKELHAKYEIPSAKVHFINNKKIAEKIIEREYSASQVH